MPRLAALSLLLTGLCGCICLPITDVRRPQARVLVDGGEAAAVKVCTWANWGPPSPDGCADVRDGAWDGAAWEVGAWTEWPVVIALEPPYWADIFVACGEAGPIGITMRNLDGAALHGAELHIAAGGPPTHPATAFRDATDAELDDVAARLCAGATK